MTLGELVVTACLQLGECQGNAPRGMAWVVLYDKLGRAQPEARPWEWIEHRLEPGELAEVKAAMVGHPSLVLFIPAQGSIEVIAKSGAVATQQGGPHGA